MLLYFKLILFAIVMGLASSIDDWLKTGGREKNKEKGRRKAKTKEKPRSLKSKLFLSILSGLVIVLSNEAVDQLGKSFERPAIDIHTTDSGNSVTMKIEVLSGTVD